ncbi:MAG: BtrH N-terminal domain-containing protein [Myxococcales bacterium]|nr:BtrH N-terminal domain-containing protein [Myxococcales bacterium]
MRKMIEGFVHTPGQHCGSTALADVANFYGAALSESMCFGLGAGAGFIYVELEGRSPSRMVLTRGMTVEASMFANLGLPFAWRTTDDPDEAWRGAREGIDTGKPVMLRCDIFHLDYYRSSTHFAGHVIVMAGYDTERGEAYLADTGFPGLQAEPLKNLAEGRRSKAPPMALHHEYLPIEPFEKTRPLARAIPRALAENAAAMLDPEPGAVVGLAGMDHLIERLPGWADEAKDWPWCARFGYQVIERRGTGGAAFRRLYVRFIEEGAAHVPVLADERFLEPLRFARNHWHALAELLRRASVTEDPRLLARAADEVRRVQDHEGRFWTEVRREFGRPQDHDVHDGHDVKGNR